MRNELFVLGRFADDPQSVLAAVCRLALVGIKLCLNLGVWTCKAGLELSITPFAYADGREGSLYDTEFTFQHDYILVHQARRA